MKRRLLRLSGWSLAMFVLAVASAAVVGGGWGEKPPLPAVFDSDARPILLAHRGLVGENPENSEAAIEDADSIGYDGVELDIQASADGEFVIYHDESTSALLGKDGELSDLTLGQIESLRLPSHNHHIHPIPVLHDVMSDHAAGLVFYLDMKRHGHSDIFSLASDISSLLNRGHWQNQTLVASAYPWFIAWLEFRHPEVITVLEGANRPMLALWDFIPQRFRPDMLASRFADLSPDLAREIEEENLDERYVAYHVDESNIDSALALGIDIMILDHGPTVDSLLAIHEP